MCCFFRLRFRIPRVNRNSALGTAQGVNCVAVMCIAEQVVELGEIKEANLPKPPIP